MAFSAEKSKGKKNRCEQPEQVKLFITSHNDEFFAERDWMRKEILPPLRTWCRNKNLTLVENFIKWGGRHPDHRNVAELEKLQTSIESCYFSSAMPLFINITSSSLGWVPLWGEYPEEVVEDYQEAYGLLCEDLELLNAAFREDNPNSLFLARDDTCLCHLTEDKKSCFAKETSASQKVTGDQDKILKKFPHYRLLNYIVEFCGVDTKNRAKLKFLDDFKEKILDFLQQRISFEYCGEDRPLAQHCDEFAKSSHLEFLNSKGRFVLGRDNIVQQIENYVIREEKDVPLMVLGASGTGKTSVMCLAAKTIQAKIEKGELPSPGENLGKWRVFYHFVGAVPGSMSLEQMLKRLLRDTGMTKNNANSAKNLDSAAQMCCSMLSNLHTNPLIIFLDAANQFTKEHGARIISWVPRKLAPQVRLVISMVTDTEVHKALVSRETKPIEIFVNPLTNASKQGIIEDILYSEGNDRLTVSQMRHFLDKPMSDNPLWLTLACQEVKLAQGLEERTEKITSLPDSLLLLFDELLHRLETGKEGDLLVGTLCLLEASGAGLNEVELRQLLANGASLKPPSPFQEKEEMEESEKENKKKKETLEESRWQNVYKTLQPFLRPYGDSKTGRLDFYHRALSKAVRKRYFTIVILGESGKNEKSGTYYFWHQKLAEFFRHHPDISRLVEEYPHHLACLDDKFHLAQCLCDWKVFDQLYQEEYSSQLMTYWRKVGPISEMVSSYEAALKTFEEDDSSNEASVSLRYEKVCRVTIQAGKHHDALELLKTAMKIEEKELGARSHRMVELYALMSEIYDEKMKLNDFVSRSQLPDLRKTIHYAKKSIHIRKTLPGSYHKFKLGVSLMRLAFNMKSWDACGGGAELSGENAVEEGNKYIDKSLKIFMELNDMGHYAEALMTKGVLAKRGSMEQLKLYNQAMELCMQMYGELHILTSRLYINIGILYEDNKDYKRSYQYFKKWAKLSEEIMGPDHPKTLRAKGVLRESRYRRIAIELGEWVEDDDHIQDPDEEDERCESSEMEHNYDDTINNILIMSQDETSLEAAMIGSSHGQSGVSSNRSSNLASSQSAMEQPSPPFNIVPLLPNYFASTQDPLPPTDYSNTHRWQRSSQPRDASSYLRSRLERSNAIRRGGPGSPSLDIRNILLSPSALEPTPGSLSVSESSSTSNTILDSNQRSEAEREPNMVCSLDSLLRELNMSGSTVFPHQSILESLGRNPDLVQNSNVQATRDNSQSDNIEREDNHQVTTCSNPSRLSQFTPIANDMEQSVRDLASAMRDIDSFNRFFHATGNPATEGENRFTGGLSSNSSRESLGQVFANGYIPSDEELNNDDSDHEGHSDSENFYDDNFEDYDEHYTIAREENVDEEEGEILVLGTAEDTDNRFLEVDSCDLRFDDMDNHFLSFCPEDELGEEREQASHVSNVCDESGT